MKQIAMTGSARLLKAPTQRATVRSAAENTLRFVQRSSRQRRLALEHQLQHMQQGAPRLGRLLDLEA